MAFVKTILSASAIAFFASTDAHMIMAQPKPYGSPNNSPLVADGSDFPCKGASSAGAQPQDMTIGSDNPLSFTGSAVHGGGSCQISLTKDNPATKSSVWQVIYSIEGGCPAKGQAGNLGGPGEGANNPAMPDPNTYSFKIPQGISPGAYTLAWTWFNKIGNREMYMNCAAINVKGGSAKRSPSLNETYAIPELTERDTSFPDMFKANIGNGCTTADSKDVQFPAAGGATDKFGSASDLAPPTGNCGAAAASSGNSASSSGSSAASPSGGAASAPSAAAAPAASGQADAQANVASGGSPASPSGSSSGSSEASPSGAAPLTVPSPPSNVVSGASSPAAANSSGAAMGVSSSTPDASSGSSSGSAGSAPAAAAPAAAPATGGTTCTGAALVCSADGTQFGLCNNGNAAMQAVAAGTKCVGGAIQKRAILPRRPNGAWSIWSAGAPRDA